MIRVIRTYPDKVLRRIAKEVDDVTEDVCTLCNDMVETMQSARGVGLAANQVGVSLRVITVETGTEKHSAPLAIINPEIVVSEGEDAAEEGCLSIPAYYETVKRARKVTVSGTDVHGDRLTMECEGLLARACQHEIDHLNGILFVDHLSPVKKQLFKKEFIKEKK